MAFGLPAGGSSEDRTPVVKYDGRAGRLFRVDRAQVNGAWQSTQVEITNVFQAIMDLELIELGWLHFPSGAAPSIVVAPYGQPLPAKPSDQHRAGFRMNMVLGKSAGGDLREMAANAQVSIKAMDALHDAYAAGVKANPGMLPVVKLGGTTPITTSGKDETGKPVSSTNYQPVWEIVKWVARPAELGGDQGRAVPPHGSGGGEVAPAATHTAPPAANPAPAPAAALVDVESDF